jgi:hypothetical protein
MKRRYKKRVLYLFCLGLLAFSLYLNFIHKEKQQTASYGVASL